MKEWLVEHHPKLLKMGKSQAAYDQLGQAIVEA
jgi:hypothetical protein